jgi:hypothetical protein
LVNGQFAARALRAPESIKAEVPVYNHPAGVWPADCGLLIVRPITMMPYEELHQSHIRVHQEMMERF